MTIDRIKLSIQTVKDNIAIMESEDITQDNIDAGYYLQLEHEKFVLEALEKQLPKKPLYIEYCDFPFCPRCKKSIDENMEDNYCSVCGQALDWNEPQ